MIKLFKNKSFWAVLLTACLIVPVQNAFSYHFPWDQGHDTTDYPDPPPPGPCEGPLCNPCNSTGSPVYIPTGHFFWRDTDVKIFGNPDLEISRSYNSNDPRPGIFGNGWVAGCEEALIPTISKTISDVGVQVSKLTYVLFDTDGKRYSFSVTETGELIVPAGRTENITFSNNTLTFDSKNGSRKIYSSDGKLLQRTAVNGRSIYYTYDQLNRLTRIRDEFARDLTFIYNVGGWVDSVTDFTGRIWQYGYDDNGNLTSVKNPAGGIKNYSYVEYKPPGDAATYYLLSSVIDESNVFLTTVEYANGTVSSYTQKSNTYTYSYDLSQRRTTKTDTSGKQWVFYFDEDQQIIREINPEGGEVTYSHDDSGNILNINDAEGKDWGSTFDSLNRVVSETDPLGNSISWGYTEDYDWPTQVSTPNGRVSTMQYDDLGNLLSYTDPTGAVIVNNWENGTLQSTTSASGGVISFGTNEYGWRNRTTDPLGRVTTTTYDSLGRVLSTTDGEGNLTSYAYDVMDRVIRITNGAGGTLNYTYDDTGKVLTLSDELNGISTYGYDSFGRLVSKTSPDGSQSTRAYNSDNTVSQITHRDGSFVSFTYDSMNRVATKNIGSEVYTYVYDSLGKMIKATNSSGEIIRGFDDAGRLISESFNGLPITYIYNSDGERVSSTYLGHTTDYTRNSAGLITAINDITGPYTIEYDEDSLKSRFTYPNNTTATFTKDDDGQLTSIVHEGVFNDTRLYQFDNNGNIELQTINGQSKLFSYDSSTRLTGASFGAEEVSYSYDASGNIVNDERQYDINNQLLSDSTRTFEYDGKGNLVRKLDTQTGDLVEYEWNNQNELKKVTRYSGVDQSILESTVLYFYGPLGRRIGKSVDGVQENYLFDGFNKIGVIDQAGNVVSRLVYGPGSDELLGEWSANSAKYYFYDHQQSVVAVGDANSTQSTYSYSPYGELLSGDSSLIVGGFTGREMDNTDLYFYRSRYYDPSMQRFISEDPIGFNGGVNLYEYVGGNPLNFTDPLGLQRGSAAWCARQRQRVENLRREVGKRRGELQEDALNLPETCPGDVAQPSLSKAGHRFLLNQAKANLAAAEALYAAYCSNNPPPPAVPVTEPVTEPNQSPIPNTNPFSGVDWGAVAVGVGVVVLIGAAIYFSGGLATPLVATSDINVKNNIKQIDNQIMLESLAELEVSSWTYNWERRNIRHVGPMAQDFRETFGLGKSDKVIELVDSNGVLFASVQALYKLQLEKKSRIDRLEQQLEEQQVLINKLLSENQKSEVIGEIENRYD